MLAFLNTPTFPVFSPPTNFNPAFILRFYLSFIFYLAFIYCVLLFTNIIYHVMRTDTCNKPHTLRDAVTGRKQADRLVGLGMIAMMSLVFGQLICIPKRLVSSCKITELLVARTQMEQI